MDKRYEAIVIGTGFGGAINACRLSKKWPGKVLVLERGKRYPLGSYPRTPEAISRNFWNMPAEKRKRPKKIRQREERGMFDVRNYRHMDVVLGAGLGGGSLIYANVFLEPPPEIFDEGWPRGLNKTALQPYYDVAKEVLGARPIPPANGDPRRRVLHNEVYEEVAGKLGRPTRLLDINVFFGNDFDNPLDIGVQDTNRYGALQTSCTYSAECDAGCNYQAKNTLDLNYLFVAENRYDATVRTEHLVEKIVPVNEDGQDDPAADGTHGYKVYFQDLKHGNPREGHALTNRVVVSAGALGSTELLLRCMQVYQTLPNINDRLGTRYSGNGDFLSIIVGSKKPVNPNYGPVITRVISFNLFENFNRDHAFLIEDASYPPFLAWFVEGIKPDYLWLRLIWRTLVKLVLRWITGRSAGSVGIALGDLLDSKLTFHSALLLTSGVDKANGVMTLDDQGRVNVDWPYKDSIDLYNAIVDAGKQFSKTLEAKDFFPLPTWFKPFRKNISVHNLGGCVLADDPSQGVTSADRATFGQVFGYRGLYVADGAIVPTAVGSNPCATISAVSEMVAHGITGIQPDADL